MKPGHLREIDRANDVYIVQDERLFAAVLEKKTGGFLQSAAGIKQHILARHFDSRAEIVVGLQIVDDNVREMMRVDNYLADSSVTQARQRDFQHCTPTDFH